MRKERSICRILATCAIAWCAGGAVAQTENFDLYVSYTDSAVVSLDLANLRSLKFSYSDRTMTANYRDGSNYTHDYTRIGSMYFAISNGVIGVETDEKMLYRLDGTMLTLHEDARLAVLYGVDGKPVMNITDRVVSLDGLTSGIYVLRVDNQTAKLCVK